MAIDRASSAIPAPQVRTPEEVVAFLGDQLERQGRHPTAGLPVDLHPLLDAAPPGEERSEVVELIDSCQHSWGWIDHSGGKGYNYVLTPLGLDVYTQIQEARRKAKLAQKPLTGLGKPQSDGTANIVTCFPFSALSLRRRSWAWSLSL